MNNNTIYVHTNLINGKKYVGQTSVDPNQRWQKGRGYKRSGLPEDDAKQPIFFKAIRKYGWDNFSHEILETNLSDEEANFKEKYYIEKYHTWVEDPECWGYNGTPGGKENPPMTDAMKKKISILIKDKWENDEEYRQKTIDAIRNVEWTEERKNMMREKIKKQREDLNFVEKAKEGARAWDKKAWEVGGILYETFHGANNPNAFPIICLNTGEIFQTCTEACLKYSLDNGCLSKAIDSDKLSCGKHPITNVPLKWSRYYEDKQYEIIGYDNKIKMEQHIYTEQEINNQIRSAKPVKCLETNCLFISSIDAKKRTGIDNSSIGRCCNGKQKLAGNYHWEYCDKEEFLELCKKLLKETAE